MTYREALARPILALADRLGFLDIYGFLRGRLSKQQATILLYHNLEETRYPWRGSRLIPQHFEDQIKYLNQQYRIISLNELVEYTREQRTLPPKVAVITLDDGYKDNYTYAYPILKKYNAPATIFLATGYLDSGGLFWWDRFRYALWNTTLEMIEIANLGKLSLKSSAERLRAMSRLQEMLKQLPDGEREHLIDTIVSLSGVNIPPDLGKELLLSWDEVREMSNNGIAFGAHTVTHPFLTELPVAEAKRQIVESKKTLEKELGKPVTAFAYPYGRATDFNDEIKQIVRQTGFACAVTTIPPKGRTPGTDFYEWGRNLSGHNLETLKFYLEVYPDLRRLSGLMAGR